MKVKGKNPFDFKKKKSEEKEKQTNSKKISLFALRSYFLLYICTTYGQYARVCAWRNRCCG